jgi:1-hydroxycarotenoid 3,4-desaturase
MRRDRVVVIGAGMGGLAAACDLAARGADVLVLERQESVGGKMRLARVGTAAIDAGPTVFTMRWVFDGLFADAGARFDAALRLIPAGVLARHAWAGGGRLDLFADIDRSAEAIGDFAGAGAARGYRDFCGRSREIYRTLSAPFMAAERPSPLGLVRRVGWQRLGALWRTAPLRRLWPALAAYFPDPRLRQLFARYATYVGSSPFRVPATLMLVAHVEQDGVWYVEGGMHRIAAAMRGLAEAQGARFRCGAEVAEILVQGGRAAGVRLVDGERIAADAVVFNGDAAALGQGLLGDAARSAARDMPPASRSLSALTWCLVARAEGFPLLRHSVFFGADYEAEFSAIFAGRRIAAAPTVYVCAQDRGDDPLQGQARAERLLVLVNAPADGDRGPAHEDSLAALGEAGFALLKRCGLALHRATDQGMRTGPAGFAALFPGSGGALYGRANHGPMASFARPGARARLPGLYLAGGSVHPGPGVPMAALSGRIAAARLLADRAGSLSRPVRIARGSTAPGGGVGDEAVDHLGG